LCKQIFLSRANNQHLAQQIVAISQANSAKIDRNQQMVSHIYNLKGSKESLETRIRYELNLIAPGETLVLLPDHIY
jgi:cell division protein FtsB